MHYACTIQRTFAHPRQVGSSGGTFRAGECGPALPLGPKRCEGHAGDAVVCGTLCALTAVQFFTIFKKWKEIEYDCAAYAPLNILQRPCSVPTLSTASKYQNMP